MELNNKALITPEFVFETSWEICNKVGGIYTVISSKAQRTNEQLFDNYIVIGPDVWKQTTANPDFLEIPELYADWKAVAWKEGLKVRTGKWNIPGTPKVILIDFTPLFPLKDNVFARFWEKYKLDSLRGEWDYIEAAMFGYAAGQVIDSFSNHQLKTQKNIIAHFHEWMTGAGVLYLKDKNPRISTVFTTHATVLGRSIAGNGLPLYKDLTNYLPEKTARDFNVTAKHSLESIAAREADIFTTVSDITARECQQFFGRMPEVITTNGFDDGFIPDKAELKKQAASARKIALEVASQHTGKTYPEDTILLLTSGRYEYTNKGIDLFIKALGQLNQNKSVAGNMVAFIAVPGNHDGVVEKTENGFSSPADKYLTHKLYHPDHDPILKEIAHQNLTNDENSTVDIIFAPVYLDKKDGVINLDYYQFLGGFDLTLFPSYYEPWGYTPLESVAFNIPTLTTTFAGFGDWAIRNFKLEHRSVTVITRVEGNSVDAIKQISEAIVAFAKAADKDKTAEEIKQVVEKASWKLMVSNYFKAWSEAFALSESRKSQLPTLPENDTLLVEAQADSDRPIWKKILIQNTLPDTLQPLKELAFNLWWSWNDDAAMLFSSIDEEKWARFENNPVHLIESLSKDEIDRLAEDDAFLLILNKVYDRFRDYMLEAKNKPEDMVAYFSMEYGLHSSLKIYSGGLGVLAGDYLKQASDSNKNMIAVGLLYRYGYFKQTLSVFGDQQAEYNAQKFTQLPLSPVRHSNGEWVVVRLAFPGRNVTAKVWQVNVGRIPLYLLDTDTEENTAEDRAITYQLYGGDSENRIKQELVLGIGGVRMIESIGLDPAIYHSNEGHSAFIGLERIFNFMKNPKIGFDAACELVRSSNLFTTHTPVPAGHDTFEEHLIRTYLPHYSEHFRISWHDFMGLGRYFPDNSNEKFSMSVLATRLSQEINGVSRIHGRVSREMFQPLYPGYFAEELHIGYVTNGVHYYTWTAPQWQKLYKQKFGDGFEQNQPNEKYWEKIYEVDDQVIWEKKLELKANLIKVLRDKLKKDLTHRQETPQIILNSLKGIDESTLIIGFARRFATYKRAHLLFTNLERLDKIVNNPKRPVVFIFSGKAHPNDKAGQDLIKRIIEISKKKEFMGKVIFLENYDMIIGKLLTSSVDIWLNTPTRPLEASGTSGEKAVMNGVVNFSVLDGWWAEGYKPDAGWAIEEAKTFANQQYQDELDAEIIYQTLENEIVKKYYDRDKNGISTSWVAYIKNTIARVAPHFTMQRQLEDYYNKFYNDLIARRKMIYGTDFSPAIQLAEWKKKVTQSWPNISMESLLIPDTSRTPLEFGKHFIAEIKLNIPGLNPEDIGVEVLMGNKADEEVKTIKLSQELKLTHSEPGKVTFAIEMPLDHSGIYDYTFRIFPKNKLLKYRMDLPLVKWL